MAELDQSRFTRTSLFITGALLVWLANFVIVYVFAAVACARGFAERAWLGLPIVPTVTSISCLIAISATVLLLRNGAAVRRHDATSASARFIGFLVVATSAIAIVALMLIALPPLLTGACVR